MRDGYTGCTNPGHAVTEKNVFIMEEVCGGSGIREALALALRDLNPDISVTGVDLGHNFATHGSMDALYQKYHLDAKSVFNSILEVVRNEK